MTFSFIPSLPLFSCRKGEYHHAHSSAVSPKKYTLRRHSIVCSNENIKSGKITLVGVGPGDVCHLTTAAENALQNADIILHDRLAHDTILHKANSKAVLESVGKARKNDGSVFNTRQDTINDRMVKLAQQGLHVVRVKGGDTAIFSRLSDELTAAREANILVEVIPGITTASVVAAVLQFPLTGGKGIADGVCFVSAHEGAHWIYPSLLKHVTLAIYMGLQELDGLLIRLAKGDQGMTSATCEDIAAVAVYAVSTPEQKVVWGTVRTLAACIREEKLKSPTVVIVGNAVRLARDWPHGQIVKNEKT